MSIIYNPNNKIFTLHTQNTTYQMMVDRYGYLLHLYYGAKNNSLMDYMLTGGFQEIPMLQEMTERIHWIHFRRNIRLWELVITEIMLLTLRMVMVHSAVT